MRQRRVKTRRSARWRTHAEHAQLQRESRVVADKRQQLEQARKSENLDRRGVLVVVKIPAQCEGFGDTCDDSLRLGGEHVVPCLTQAEELRLGQSDRPTDSLVGIAFET
jgi:hypothetical protein